MAVNLHNCRMWCKLLGIHGDLMLSSRLRAAGVWKPSCWMFSAHLRVSGLMPGWRCLTRYPSSGLCKLMLSRPKKMKVLSGFTESICQEINFPYYCSPTFLMTELTRSTAPQSHLSCITFTGTAFNLLRITYLSQRELDVFQHFFLLFT